jgi:hypothetical protein
MLSTRSISTPIDLRPPDGQVASADQPITTLASAIITGQHIQLNAGDLDADYRVTSTRDCDGGPECPTVAARCVALSLESLPDREFAAIPLGEWHLPYDEEIVVLPAAWYTSRPTTPDQTAPLGPRLAQARLAGGTWYATGHTTTIVDADPADTARVAAELRAGAEGHDHEVAEVVVSTDATRVTAYGPPVPVATTSPYRVVIRTWCSAGRLVWDESQNVLTDTSGVDLTEAPDLEVAVLRGTDDWAGYGDDSHHDDGLAVWVRPLAIADETWLDGAVGRAQRIATALNTADEARGGTR